MHIVWSVWLRKNSLQQMMLLRSKVTNDPDHSIILKYSKTKRLFKSRDCPASNCWFFLLFVCNYGYNYCFYHVQTKDYVTSCKKPEQTMNLKQWHYFHQWQFRDRMDDGKHDITTIQCSYFMVWYRLHFFTIALYYKLKTKLNVWIWFCYVTCRHAKILICN